MVLINYCKQFVCGAPGTSRKLRRNGTAGSVLQYFVGRKQGSGGVASG